MDILLWELFVKLARWIAPEESSSEIIDQISTIIYPHKIVVTSEITWHRNSM